MKDGTKIPILPYDLFDMPRAEAGPFGVVRSGGHFTLAQLLYLQSLAPSQQLPYRRGEKTVTRDMLKGYVAVTVRFRENKADGWTPEIVSWKSLQLNVNNWREWLDSEPPLMLKSRIFQQVAIDVNRRWTPSWCPLGLVK